MVSDIAGKTLNYSNGLFRCCGEGFRYKGGGPAPLEMACEECGEIVANDSIQDKEAIESSIKSDPNFLRHVFENTKHYHPIHCQFIKELTKAGKFQEAIEIGWRVHERAKADNFKGTGPIDQICAAHLEWERVEKKAGNKEKAESIRADFVRIQSEFLGITINHDLKNLVRDLGKPLKEKSDGYSILECVEAEIKNRKDETLDAKYYNELIRLLDKAMTAPLSPYYQAKAHRAYGDAYAKLGDKPNEIEHLKRALALNPKVGVKTRLDKLEAGQP